MRIGLAVLLTAGIMAAGSAAHADDEAPCPPPLVHAPGQPGVCVDIGTPPTPAPPSTVNPIAEPTRPDLRPSSTAPVVGADHRPCVSKREVRGAKDGWSRAETERRWDVQGMSRVVPDPIAGKIWTYPRCGYSRSEAWAGAAFDRKGLWTTVTWKDPGATLHGRP